MTTFKISKAHLILAFIAFLFCLLLQQPASASPFGQGLFGADVPFGSNTSMSIALGGNVSFTLTPAVSTFSGTGSHTITVTSTDVVGYVLYAYSPTSTNMVNGSYTIPASANVSPAALSINTWGYNTNASSNFVGMRTTPSLIKDAVGPFKSGDNTTVTYGAYTDITKGAGAYTVPVIYTAVAKND